MELLDIYDDEGNKTGRTIIRGDKNVELSPMLLCLKKCYQEKKEILKK